MLSPTNLSNSKEVPVKRLIAALSATAVMAIGGGAAIAAAPGAPEIDEANASMQLKAVAPFVPTRCAGEDGIPYETFRGTWKGGETDLTPGTTDYSLSGPMTVKGIVWTINLKTDRGLLRGSAVLTGNAATAPTRTYVGPVTLITQGLPDAAGAVVPARGWINAATYTKDAADGGSLLANLEMRIGPVFSANGQFGNGSLGFPDLSVTTNNQTC
jgi:hypothetical protein